LSAKETNRIEPPRIGYVNVAKVLGDFRRMNQECERITARRIAYLGQAKSERDLIQQLTLQYNATRDSQLKKALQEQALAANRRLEAIDKEATENLTDLSNKNNVAVFRQISDAIADLAKDRGLDVVEGFSAAWLPENQRGPEVAKSMLHTPALMPYYLKPELDFTDEIIERLNKKYPPEKDDMPAR
jgi:Skp family chaperone for outer membrane proteins